MINKDERICIVGDKGTLGVALKDQLLSQGYECVIPCHRPEVDCTSYESVRSFFSEERPDYVFFTAAISAGIEYKRKYPVEVLLENLQMVTNLLSCAHEFKCKRLLNVCSALLYPRSAEMPLKEEAASFTNLDEIDTPYSLAKAAGYQLCKYYKAEYGDDFFTVVPCNFFGKNSAFDGDRAGVVPSLIKRITEAKYNGYDEVLVWGTGNACREFLNSKDVADACIFLMNREQDYDLINIGRGVEYSIKDTAMMIKDVIGYEGNLKFDSTKPEGRQHMQLDTSKIFDLGWYPKLDLRESINDAYEWYISTNFRRED